MKFPVFRQILKNSPMEDAVNNAKKWIKDHKDDPNTMFTHFCPYCGAPLEATDRKEKLETLDEHVTCSEVTEKIVYKCSNNCNLSTCKKWNNAGESYYDFPDNISEEERCILWKTQYKIDVEYFDAKYHKWPTEAIGSYHYSLMLEYETPNRRLEFPIRLYKNQKIVPVIERHYIFDKFGKALKVDISLHYRKYSDKNSYMIWHPWYVEPYRLIKETYRNYCNWKRNPSTLNLKRLYGKSRFRSLNRQTKLERVYFEHIIPFVFGKCMGIEYNK